MGKLMYKTIAGAPPRDMPQVYFCANPLDLQDYFATTAAELFEVQSCALWYDADPVHPNPDWQLELSQMQLFVVTVTSAFLYEDCRARLVELPFALQRHIPVLPILREPDLAEEFGRLCGNMQALEPCKNDLTALPYKEKLRRFLESVLIGDELAAQVRHAFEAYIFLSYRKKDRKVARELMQLIHQNEFCRDVAIWYDEFLTVGEDFNQSIAQALEKSRLFALVVTPNLNEEKNYVQQVEYPMARQSGKNVLPVEMVDTDRSELEKHFEALPPCVPGQDAALLSRRLLDNLQDLALRPKKDDPRHDYFIGLAYLGGIDVETDPAQGAQLIRSAAERGYLPAVRRWANMLRNGEGVEENLQESVRWRQLLIEELEKHWRENGQEQYLSDLLNEYGNLVGTLTKLDQLEQALALARKGADLAQQFSNPVIRAAFLVTVVAILSLEEQNAEAESLAEAVVESERKRERNNSDQNAVVQGIMLTLGLLQERKGNLASARRWYEEALACCEEELRDIGGETVRQRAATAYSTMAGLCRREGALGQARQWAQKACEEYRFLLREMDSDSNRAAMASTLRLMANLCLEADSFAEAEEYLMQEKELLEETDRRKSTPSTRKEIAGVYMALGDLFKKKGWTDHALEWYQKAAALLEELPRKQSSVLCALSSVYDGLGDLYQEKADWSNARIWYEKACALAESLPNNQTEIWVSRASSAYLHMAHLCLEQEDRPGVRHWYEKYYALHKEREEKKHTVSARQGLLHSCVNMGDVCRDENDPAGARRWYEKARCMAEKLATETDAAEFRRDLADCYERLGRLCQKEGDTAGARAWWEKAYTVTETLARLREGAESRRDLAKRSVLLGDLCRKEGNLTGARTWYEKAHALTEALAAKEGTVEQRSDLADSYERLGNLCEAENNQADARRWQEKVCALTEELARETHNPWFWQKYSMACANLGLAYWGETNWPKARKWYEKACAVDLELEAEKEKCKPFFWEHRLSDYDSLGFVCRQEGDLDKACFWYEKAFEGNKDLLAETGDIRYRRKMANICGNLGEIWQERQDLPQAGQWFDQEQTLALALMEEERSPENEEVLSCSYGHLAALQEAEGDLSAALALYDRQAILLREMIRQSGTDESRCKLMETCCKAKKTLRQLGRDEEAAAWGQEAGETARDLMQRPCDAPTKDMAIHVAKDLFLESVAAGKIAQADRQLQDLIGPAEKQAEETGSQLSCLQLGELYFRCVNLYDDKCKDPDRARPWLEKTADWMESCTQKWENDQTRQIAGYCCCRMGELDRDDPTCARRWYERGVELLTPYENQAGESWAHGNLAKCLLALGEMEQQDQRPEAREKYRRALRLFTELCTENAKDEIRRGRTVCLTRLAEYCLEEGDATQAQSLCAEGIQCLEKVCVRGTDEETAGDLAYAATVMARACLEQNQTDQAIGWYKNAATWYMELSQATQLAWIYGRAALCRYALSHLEQDWRPWLEEAISIWDTLARECPQIPEYAHHLEVARQELALRLEQEKAPPEQR